MCRAAAMLVFSVALGLASAQTPQASPCRLPPTPLPSQTRAVFVLDTSGSMRGLGDGQADIFEPVKSSINTFVRQQQPDQVELLTFDAGVRSRQSFTRPAGTPAWNAALGALQAGGQNTFLYRSLRDALQPLGGAQQFITTVFVLTDGIDNDKTRTVTPQQALAAFQGRGPLDRLYYVALGTDIPRAARQALQDSEYASGLLVPAGQVPTLGGANLTASLIRVTEPQVPLPLPDGTTLTLDAGTWAHHLTLAQPTVQGGQAVLRVNGNLPYTAQALLCAAPQEVAGLVAPKPQQALLQLHLGGPPLTWLNPGAHRHLQAGQDVVLRYRAAPGVPLNALLAAPSVSGLPAGLHAQVERQPGAREFAVRLTHAGADTPALVTPILHLGPLSQSLPALSVQAGRSPTTALHSSPAGTSLEGQTRLPRRLIWLLTALAAAAVLAAVLLSWRRRPQVQLSPVSGPPSRLPQVRGIQYSAGRTLSLMSGESGEGGAGQTTDVPTPLGGPFDLGLLARVPLLSGLRASQHPDGLRLLRIPPDLEVSQGTRVLHAGDVVRPGTLLDVRMAREGRLPSVPLGTLAGLGLPLTLRCEDITLHLRGPFGEHTLTLPDGRVDLGVIFQAPVLQGLQLTASGTRVLLSGLPEQVNLRRPGDSTPLLRGVYLPEVTLLDLPRHPTEA